jgi:hypothetical protein
MAHLDHVNQRAILVKAARDLLASKDCDMGRSIG